MQAPLPFFSKMCAFTLSRLCPVRAAGAGFWEPVGCQIFIFFKCFFNTLQEPQKNRLKLAPRGFLSQLGRFRKPTWPPKRIQNLHFFGFKRQLMLKRAKTQNLMRVLHLEHIFASSGRPKTCLLYTSPSPRDAHESRMPSSA